MFMSFLFILNKIHARKNDKDINTKDSSTIDAVEIGTSKMLCCNLDDDYFTITILM